MGLDLYATIEPLLGFEEEKHRLYRIYLERLELLGAKRVLDIGCGSGAFMRLAKDVGFEILGVDLSQEMVRRAKEEGLECECIDICDLDGSFDAAVAIFDVLNYIPPQEVESFMGCVARLLKGGGHFLFDINTLYGFEEVAQGALWIDGGDLFVALDAEFGDGKLVTDMVYFEKKEGCFIKKSDTIVQYYHEVTIFKKEPFKLVDLELVSLFGEDADKALIVLEKD